MDAQNLPQITSAEQREAFQRAADTLERQYFPRSQGFDPLKWQRWLSQPPGLLCTAIIDRIEEWDERHERYRR